MVPVIRSLRPARLNSVYALSRALGQAGLRRIPLSEDTAVLCEPVRLCGSLIPNRMAVQPMEGFDAGAGGAPGPTTFQRYEAYAAGGAGLIWFESAAVSPDGMDSPHQLSISRGTLSEFRALTQAVNRARIQCWGEPPVKLLQLTHSGRASQPRPLTAFPNPYLDPYSPVPPAVVSDRELDALAERTFQAALLARRAGFDGVDLKCCHNYLFRELLAGFTRSGAYGGSFHNRTRFLLELVDRIRTAAGPQFLISVRLNAYDSVPYPYGWGMVQEDGVMRPDLSEPKRLIRLLEERGVRLFNITSMFPRVAPTGEGFLALFRQDSEILPFEGMDALLRAMRELKQAAPRSIFVGTGLSWFERFAPNVGAGGIKRSCFDVAGFGRMALAYPGFFTRVLRGDTLDPSRCCVTCDGCYRCMEAGGPVVCALRHARPGGPGERKERLP